MKTIEVEERYEGPEMPIHLVVIDKLGTYACVPSATMSLWHVFVSAFDFMFVHSLLVLYVEAVQKV
jgi:multisubunit Na+/H+ antiporter MnhF subunit